MRISAGFIGLATLVAPLVAAAPAELESREPLTTLFSSRQAPDGARNVNEFLGNELNRVFAKYSSAFRIFEDNVGRVNALLNASSTRFHKRATVPLTDLSQELLWVGPISTGTPPQTVQTDFDTGSSDFVLYPGSYKPSASSTAVKAGRSFKIQYGDGSSLSGDVYQDTVTLGGLVAKKQAVGYATQSSIQSVGDQAITGLAFPSISSLKADPVHITLIKQGKMAPLFAFGLSTTKARLDLGGLNAASYQGPIAYSKVDSSQGFWATSGRVNSLPISTAIIDTGTSLIIGPPAQVAAVCIAAGGIVQPNGDQLLCTYTNFFKPSFTFNFGGKDFRLSDAALNFASLNGLNVAPIIGADVGINGWIIGDSFLRDVYAVFDYGKKRVGFAPRKL